MEDQNNTLVLTLYTIIGDFSRIAKSIIQQFGPVTQGVMEHSDNGAGTEHLVIRLQDGSLLDTLIQYESSYIDQQIPGMRNYFAQAPCQNPEVHKSVLEQISVFNCITNIRFVETAEQNRTNHLINTAFDVASDITAIVLFPSMELYTKEKKLLLSADGRTAYNEYIPVGNSDYLDHHCEEGPEDAARRERSMSRLRERNIVCLERLKAAVTEQQAVIRAPKEVTDRLFTLFGVCVYAEAMGESSRQEALAYFDEVEELACGKAKAGLTPRELAFLEEDAPSPQALANFGWRYECCHVLLWALGYFDQLGFPDRICDVPAIARIMWSCGSLEAFMEKSCPRSKTELLDAADFILRCHWAAVEARIKGEKTPAGMDEGVLYEWHYALNWLIGANHNADWDQIQPNT